MFDMLNGSWEIPSIPPIAFEAPSSQHMVTWLVGATIVPATAHYPSIRPPRSGNQVSTLVPASAHIPSI